MKIINILCLFISSISWAASPAIWDANSTTRLLTNNLNFNNNVTVLSGSGDPSALSYPAGTVYIRYAGAFGIYQNIGTSVSPNWQPFVFSGDAIQQGGNSFGEDIEIGANDNFGLTLKTNNIDRFFITDYGTVGVGIDPILSDAPESAFQVYQTIGDIGSLHSATLNTLIYAGNVGSVGEYAPFKSVMWVQHTSGNLNQAYGQSNLVKDETATGNISSMFGSFNRVAQSGSGDVDIGAGVYVEVDSDSTNGALRDAKGLYVGRVSAISADPDTGFDHTATGIFISSSISAQGGDTNTEYAIKSEATAQSEFSGTMRFLDACYVTGNDSADVIMTLQGVASQSGHMLDVKDSSNNIVSYLDIGGNFNANKLGSSLGIKEGSNAKMGKSTLSGGTITVSTTAVTSASRIHVTCNSSSTAHGALWVDTITAGTSFKINSTNVLDDCQVAWLIVEAL